MQLAGEKCSLCNQPIVLALEGTWCVQCGAILHVECLAGKSTCPRCHKALIDPVTLFVYAKSCPTCGRETTHSSFCPSCGTKTCWETQAIYATERARIRFAGWMELISGIALTVFGLALLGLVPFCIDMGILFMGPGPWAGGIVRMLPIAMCVPLSFWCLMRAWTKIWHSGPARSFR